MTKGKLVFVGLGLYDEKDVSLKGLEEIKNCDKVYAEFYTAKLVGTDIKKIEKTLGKPVEVLTRDETEKGDKILDSAKNKRVVFLTCGDPMTATTHVDIRLRAANNDIETKVIHGSSIATAVAGLLGLQNYKFGRATTLVFPEKNYFPTSPYEVIRDNRKMGLHTLVLLDIQADNNRFMAANEGLELLLEMEKKQREKILSEDSMVCIVARAGSHNPTVMANTIGFMKNQDFGPPLHTIVVPGNLHFMEIEALARFAGLPIELGKKCKD